MLLIAAIVAMCIVQSCISSGVRTQDAESVESLEKEILAIKQQYDQAQLRNDGEWFRRMFADGYVFVLPDSTVITKEKFIDELVSRDLVWASLSVTDTRARVYGQTAVVTGRFFGKGTYKGKPLEERQFFTSVWMKQNGQWRAISEHASNLPPK
jgi:hypothetical protein